MNKSITVAKKELAFYLNNPAGYIIAILFAVFASFLFIKDIFLRGNTSMRSFFDAAPWLLTIFIPAVAMRIISEEKRTHTLEVLLSLPLTERQVVVGKFMGLMIFSLISLALTLSIPIAMMYLGHPTHMEIVISYMGALFLIALYSSLSLFFSSLTTNQVVAFLSSVLVLFLLNVVGGDFAASFLPQVIRENSIFLTPLYHYEAFLKGVIDVRSVFYFISTTAAFIFLTVIMLERRD